MAARTLHISFDVKAVGVSCGACGDTRALVADGTGDGLRGWVAAHHQPWLVSLFAQVNGGPVQAHQLSRRRLLR